MGFYLDGAAAIITAIILTLLVGWSSLITYVAFVLSKQVDKLKKSNTAMYSALSSYGKHKRSGEDE